jgi:hypothetical protein
MQIANASYEISKAEADLEIKEFITLRERGYPTVRSAINRREILPTPEVIEYYNTEKNAFLFDRDDILKFFFGQGATLPDFIDGTAEYLLVILGSHTPNTRGFAVGSPTTILAGVVEVPKADVPGIAGDESVYFKTTFGTNTPAVQWEKQHKVTVLPDPRESPAQPRAEIFFELK